uniref:Putative potassium channel n=1 Tax=Rhizochromulina virus RhiV-SA1 TaxID=2775153 RepID=A0A7L7T4E5_9VIRU|nr:putative potassium channel [Rhizochromulina virus RhiV-SA1]
MINRIKAIRFIFFNLICSFIFGVLYYLVQFIEENAFLHPIELKLYISKNNKKRSLLRCIYFGLVTQTSIGYGGFVPYGPIASSLNALQMVSIFIINSLIIF